MTRPRFTLTVAATQDGYIARAADHDPADWVSPEEQALFRQDLDRADWQVLGRNTDALAPSTSRRRIVFSSRGDGWRTPLQLWLDPEGLTPTDLARRLAEVHPLKHGLILGGRRVHDWFARHGAIDRVHLTIEPVTFGGGIALFTDAGGRDPEAVFAGMGFEPVERRRLNARGTLWLDLTMPDERTD